MSEYVFGMVILGYFGLIVYMWDMEPKSASQDKQDSPELNNGTK